MREYKKVDSHIIKSLVEIVGTENLLVDDHELVPYTRDHQWVKYPDLFAFKPEVVILPESADQIVKIVHLANQERIPIVPCGARTGMTGNCVPLHGGIQVDMKKMNKIIEIDTDNMVAVVQSGISLYRLDRELRKHGFICGHMPGSQPTATVGGGISTNGWSEHRMKYGDIQDQITSLQVVLPTGELVKVGGGVSGKVEKSSVGFGTLKHLFIGAWGTLGIVTEATLRIFPAPEHVYSAAIAFDSLDQACKAACKMFMTDIPMSYLLVGDRNSVEFSRKVSPTYPDVNCVMTIIIEGNREIVETSKKLALKICEEFGGKDLGPEMGKAVWEEAYDAWGSWVTAYGPGYPLDEEGSIPYNRAPEVVRHFEEIFKKYDIDVIGIVVGLAPQYPILGCFWRVDERNEKKWVDYKRVSEEIAEIYLKEGGTISMAHGLGTRREEKFLPVELGSSYELMKKIKVMLDPNNIMNPGRFGLDDAYKSVK
jgi:glycolate oxidase